MCNYQVWEAAWLSLLWACLITYILSVLALAHDSPMQPAAWQPPPSSPSSALFLLTFSVTTVVPTLTVALSS